MVLPLGGSRIYIVLVASCKLSHDLTEEAGSFGVTNVADAGRLLRGLLPTVTRMLSVFTLLHC